MLTMLLALSLFQSASVGISWIANTETDIAGYKVYYGNASGNYTQSIDVGPVINFVVTGLTPGQTYYFAVTAYNTSGVESTFSNEIFTTISLLPFPSPPAIQIGD